MESGTCVTSGTPGITQTDFNFITQGSLVENCLARLRVVRWDFGDAYERGTNLYISAPCETTHSCRTRLRSGKRGLRRGSKRRDVPAVDPSCQPAHNGTGRLGLDTEHLRRRVFQ